MIWLFLVVLAAAAFAALWRFGRPDRAGLQLVASALLLGLAGYAWQGSPGLPGSPRSAAERGAIPETAFSVLRRDMFGQFDTADRWLTISESLRRSGDTGEAASAIRAGLNAYPRNAVLWTGYGDALVLHGGGRLGPAADLAFRRATELAPRHPGPRLFHGIALAQSGRVDEAEQAWRDALALSPPDAPWRAGLEQQLRLVGEARRAGQLR